MKNPALFIGSILIMSVYTLPAQESFISTKLQKVWEATEGLNIPESSHYNVSDKFIYVSNVAGKPFEKDGLGFISKIDNKGQVINKEWFTGLNAPKGVACSSTKLYVTDIDRVVEVDLKTGELINEYRNSKSKSLNDISISPDGKVFVSDSGGNCVFVIGSGSLDLFLESDELDRMNGIMASEDLLFLGSKGNFISINRKSKEVRVLAENVGYLDGIVQVADQKYVTSDWKGKVQLIEIGKGTETLMDGTPASIYAADLDYISSGKLLLVPTFSKNSVVAYRLNIGK